MLIFHGNLYKDEFIIWAETEQSPFSETSVGQNSQPPYLPFCASYPQIREAIDLAGLPISIPRRHSTQATLWIPARDEFPSASNPVIFRKGDTGAGSSALHSMTPWTIPALRLDPDQLPDFVGRCADTEQLADGILIGQDLRFWALALQFAGRLVARQQFLPGLKVSDMGGIAVWEPVFLGDDGIRLLQLAQGMPGVCRAYGMLGEHSASSEKARLLLETFLTKVVDFLVRKFVDRSKLSQVGPPAINDSATRDIHSRWLLALLTESPQVPGKSEEISRLCDQIAEWRRPVEISAEVPFRLRFRLEEPKVDLEEPQSGLEEECEGGRSDTVAAGEAIERTPSKSWYLRFLLQSSEDPGVILPVDAVLSKENKDHEFMSSGRVHAREYLFRALGQAVRLFPQISRSFNDKVPAGIELDTEGAYEFLSRTATTLKNSGFSVHLPSWWTEKRGKIACRLKEFPKIEGSGLFKLDSLAEFDWELLLGSAQISVEELQRLAELKVPLINLNGVWVELNPEKLQSILQFFKKQSTKKASQGELVRMALGDVRLPDGVTFDGITGEGPVTKLVEQLQGQRSFEEIPVEDSFAGTLRAYQSRGMSWLYFLKSVGFGACLADDMGLGKTVQALAFIQSIWHKTADADRLPNLLICPTSVLSNWQNEAQKFTPELNVILHHGLDRLHGAAFRRAAKGASLVVTTYSLMLRDQEDLRSIKWESIILDEAQNIKNPQSLQTKTACSLKSNFRVALSGTPVENNVGDLWSLMNFLNPGYLGRYSEFKDRFYVPIQVFQDQEKTEQLKRLTAPFVLRRLKTDKSIIPDLPEKHERKTSCYLTKEQATLYAAVVESATNSIDEATGMKRKSLVLTTLLRLKQICDHPALFITDKSRLAERSGKLKRLAEMSRNIIDGGESILIFTQFKQMGGIIQQHLQNTLGKEVLFLHGGIERSQRVEMVERFQNDPDGPPVFILSLKAGGTGLNLTKASHVFHFDRWWNPAVEDQATDRAYRIGQTNNVQVHKFVCPGTLEERIDELIERKKIIAANAVGAGEGWLTELSTADLKDVFSLRDTALVC